MKKALILDGNERSALAAARSLGSKAVPIVVADKTARTLAGSSKYCKESFVYPSPVDHPDRFIQRLQDEVRKKSIEVIFPMTEITTYMLLRNRDSFPGVKIPFAPFEDFGMLSDKWQLFKLAQEINIPFPRTTFINHIKDLDGFLKELKFPVVIKPYRSRIFNDGRWISTSVKYADSLEDLKNTIHQKGYLIHYPFLIQEYIQGVGQGIFALYDHGQPVIFFAHRRLREKPPSGGVSVLSESIPLNPILQRISEKIFDRVKWHGVAMVEFKVALDGIPYLMEVNPRFWGSLQLAIYAGVDFPWMLYQMARGETPQRPNHYEAGIKCRWLLGDLDNLYLQLFRSREGREKPSPGKWKSLKGFLNFFDGHLRYEVNRWDDLKPFLFEARKYFLDSWE